MKRTRPRSWDASGLSFTVTNAAGDQQNFGYWLQHYNTSVDAPSYCGRASGFRLNSWTFPQGMTVSLAYDSGTTSDGNKSSSPNAANSYPDSPFPLAVSNNLGRTLTFGVNGVNQPTVSDGHGRTLTGPSLGVSSTADPNGTITNFTLGPGQATTPAQRPVPYGQLTLVATPYIGTDPHTFDLRYDYDALGQVMAVHDAVALQTGSRGAYAFYIADGERYKRTTDAVVNGMGNIAPVT